MVGTAVALFVPACGLPLRAACTLTVVVAFACNLLLQGGSTVAHRLLIGTASLLAGGLTRIIMRPKWAGRLRLIANPWVAGPFLLGNSWLLLDPLFWGWPYLGRAALACGGPGHSPRRRRAARLAPRWEAR